MQRGLRVITLQGAIEKSPILLSQYWKYEWLDGNIIISYFGGSNNIFAYCISIDNMQIYLSYVDQSLTLGYHSFQYIPHWNQFSFFLKILPIKILKSYSRHLGVIARKVSPYYTNLLYISKHKID